MNKREFLKYSLIGGVFITCPSLLLAEEKRRARGGAEASDLPLVEPGTGMAASVHYFHKGSDVKDSALKTDRQGVAFAKQDCKGCAMYTKYSMKNGEEVGKCGLFANQVVKGSGWCNSWAKKA